jgi:hypothetical protein
VVEAPLRACARHHSSCATLRLRFNLPQPGVSIIRAAPHFVVRPRFSLDQDNVPARAGKMRRNRGAGDSTTYDQCLGCEGHVLPLSSRNTIDRVIKAF